MLTFWLRVLRQGYELSVMGYELSVMGYELNYLNLMPYTNTFNLYFYVHSTNRACFIHG